MKIALWKSVPALAALGMALIVGRAGAQTLTVTDSVSLNQGVYTYTYAFRVTGDPGSPTPAVTDLFLGSDDLSPLNTVITRNNAPTSAWTFLGNSAPYNYLQFTNLGGADSLGNGDELEVTFEDASSLFQPDTTHFVQAYDINAAAGAGGYTASVSNVFGPTANPVPEPGALSLVGAIAMVGAGWLGRRRKPHA